MMIRRGKPNGLMALIDVSLMVAFVALANSAFLSQDLARHASLDIQLPQESASGALRKGGEVAEIVLMKDGLLRINGQAVEIAELPHRISSGQAVRILADREARAAALLQLEHSLSKSGVSNVTFLVEGGHE